MIFNGIILNYVRVWSASFPLAKNSAPPKSYKPLLLPLPTLTVYLNSLLLSPTGSASGCQ